MLSPAGYRVHTVTNRRPLFSILLNQKRKKRTRKFGFFLLCTYAPNTLRTKPAATAEPITPATFGPIACMSRKFAGLAFWPSTCETRAAIGTADTPAEPISGFTLPPVNLYITLPNSRPPTVENVNVCYFFWNFFCANNLLPFCPCISVTNKSDY